MAFDPIFRWLQNSVNPRDPSRPDCLQPVPRAYADDFAFAALSFRSLMPASSPAFKAIECIAGLNLNHGKCYWVQYGNDSCHDLLNWISANCKEFRGMKVVKYGKYVGTMIGPEGHLHRWTAPLKKFIQRCRKSTKTSKSLVKRLVDFKVYALSVLGYNGYYFEASSMGSSLWG